jgi:hypothetical protein
MATTVPLRVSTPATVDGAGKAVAKIGPVGARETWRLSSVHVQVSTVVLEATCAIYVGDSATQPNFRDQTFTGSSGDASSMVDSDVLEGTGRYVFAVWTGADIGATAYLVILGTKDI